MLDNFRKKFKNQGFRLLAYKLTHDIMFFLLISFFLCLILESAIPEMVSKNSGFLILSLLITADILLGSILGKSLGLSFKMKKRHNLFPLAVFFAFIMMGNALLKFALWQNLAITTGILVAVVLLYNVVFQEEN